MRLKPSAQYCLVGMGCSCMLRNQADASVWTLSAHRRLTETV